MNKWILSAAIAVGLSACGTVNSAIVSKQKHVEFYRIFDIKTDANRNDVADAASKGLARWVSNEAESRPIPNWSTPPEKPGRFSKVSPQMGGNLGALMALSGQTLSLAKCDDAVWFSKAVKDVAGTGGINVTACLFQYKGGYHLDFYGAYDEKSGFTLDPRELAAKAVSATIGSGSEWMEKMVNDTTLGIKNDANAKITFIEGYPKSQETPWWDK